MKLLGKIFIFFILVFAVLSAACTTQVSYEDDKEDTTPLQIYIITDNYYVGQVGIKRYVESYNNQFNRKGKLDVEAVKYSMDEAEMMYEDILNEMSIGKGPDIIYINSETDLYIDISKISQQNAFADLDVLIEKSESFDITEYNQAALDAGVIDGKRVFMPISYKIEYMMSVEECFANNYLEVPERLTFETYLDLLETYYQYEKNNPAMLGIDVELILSSIINDEGKFNNDILTRRMFEILKEENKRSEKGKLTKVESWEDYFSNVENFINTNYLFYDDKYSGWRHFLELHLQYNTIENKYDSSFLWYEYPISYDGAPLASASKGLAININSKHKNEAFEFVEYVLSDGVQSNTLCIFDLPVNLKIYENKRDDFVKGYNYFGGYEGGDGIYSGVYFPKETFLPDDLVKEYLEYIESAEEYKYLGNIRYVYHNILKDIIEDYYNDRISFDDLIDNMNSKLGLYYSE